jgi:pimeloyl-ACP methyl ester carboxylesterase
LDLKIYEQGTGAPLVLIPALQGRWEYSRPTIDALARSFHVVTFSFEGNELDAYTDQVGAAMTAAGLAKAAICGVSFGGIVALRFAARFPERCEALVLASTPRPLEHLRPRHAMYARAPRLFGPVFVAETPLRVRPELMAALPDFKTRSRFSWDQVKTLIQAPLSFTGMAARAKLMTGVDTTADCAHITAPTLVITGEAALDRVVPVAGSTEYGTLIRNARVAVLERTGHLGSITRPDAFAALVRDFIEGQRHAAA